MDLLLTLCSLAPFYLLGSFPSGLLIAKRSGIDLTSQGSGNIGATNVLRVLGKRAGALTLFGDILKGFLAVVLANLISAKPGYFCLCGVAAVCGHCISLPLTVGGIRLKGGKGVATAFGVLLFIEPISAVCGLLIFGVLLTLFQIVSLASVSASLLIPICALLLDIQSEKVLSMIVISLIVVYCHKDNLSRLVRGEEKKISANRS